MAQIFRTEKNSSQDVEIVGVGFLGKGGRGGALIENAALVMPELQERDKDGNVKLDDDGQAIPLSGSKLTAAAKKFAEDRGLVVENVSEDVLAKLPQELGAAPDRPPLIEVSQESYKELAPDLEPDDPVDPVVPDPNARKEDE